MTDQPETQVQVTQADIDAAFDQANKGYQSQYDFEMDLRQAFARHRLSSAPASPSVELDERLDRAETYLEFASHAGGCDTFVQRYDGKCDCGLEILRSDFAALRTQPASGDAALTEKVGVEWLAQQLIDWPNKRTDENKTMAIGPLLKMASEALLSQYRQIAAITIPQEAGDASF